MFCIAPNPLIIIHRTQPLLIGKESDETDVSFHLYEAARGLIEAIDLKTNFDRSAPIARQYISEAVTFALLGLGFSSAEEAIEYLGLEE